MTAEEYDLFTFDSTHAAIAAQALLEDFSPIVMPTLREIRASCGMSLRLCPEKRDKALSRMRESADSWQLWHVKGENGRPDCALIEEKRGT